MSDSQSSMQPANALSPRDRALLTLTEQDHLILQMLSQGGIDKQMAPKLGLTVHGTKSAVNRTRRKLGALNRVHAVAIAFRKGIIR